MERPLSKRLTTAAVTSVFTVTSLMTVLPAFVASAADEEDSYLHTDDGFAYIVNEGGTITIKGYDKTKSTDETKIILPSTIDGKLVTEIDTNDFGHGVYSSNSTVTEIVLPDHIEKINNWAFNDYKALDTLIIPKTLKEAVRPFTYGKINKVIIEDGMETIPDALFSCTDYMGELVIPDSVTAIGANAFEAIGGITEITIPDSVRSIGKSAFRACPDLKTLNLPDQLDFIGGYAFEELKSLESFTIPEGWTFDAESGGFFQKSGLKEVTFAGSREVIPQGMFCYCDKLETVNWCEGVKEIQSRAFEETAITDPKLPDSVEVISDMAFEDSKINHLDLPKNLKELGNRSFAGTYDLKYLYVPMQIPARGTYSECSAFGQSGIEKLVFADGITEVNAITSKLPDLVEVSIPDSVTFINAYAFNDDKLLAQIDLPDSVTRIHYQSVFSGCDNLIYLSIPPYLESDKGCFGSAPNLAEAEIRDGMEKIPNELFSWCDKLKTVHIPESVTYIGDFAFSRCEELEELDMKQESIEFGPNAFDMCNNLWDERVSTAKNGDLYITSTRSSGASGSLTNYTVYYAVNPGFVPSFSEGYIQIGTGLEPDVIAPESLAEGIELGKYGFTYYFTEPTGALRFSVRNPEDKEVEVSAEFGANILPEYPRSSMKRKIITSSVNSSAVTLNAPSQVGVKDGKSTFSVYGYSTAKGDVTILVNGEEYTTVPASKYTAKFSAEIECTNVDGIITVQAVCGEKKSDELKISVDEASPVLVDFEVAHSPNGNKWQKDMTDMFRTGYSPYVTINPSKPLEFDVKMDNDDNIDKVLVISETNGKPSYVPLDKDKETGTWKGSGNFKTTIPGDLSIGQIPKSATGTAVKKISDDGKVTLEKDGKDILNPKPESSDPMKDIVDKSEIKVIESSTKMSRVKVKTPLGPDLLPPDWDIPMNIEINIVQFITKEITIEDKQLTAEDVAKAPEENGFTKSGMTCIDENGDENSYYVMYLTDKEKVESVAKNISTSDGTADKFLNDGDADASGGMVLLRVNEKTGDKEFESELFGDNEKFLLKDQAGGVVTSLMAKGLKGAAEGVAGGATILYGVVTGLADTATAYNNYSMDMEQIDYCRDPYVQANKPMLKARTKAVFYGRVLLTAATVTAGTALTLATTVTLGVGLLIGAAVGIGAYLINKLILDPMENETRSKIYVTGKNKMNVKVDPSGYVYAAVPENRIEGATATIYYKDDSGAAVKWNAEDFEQENDLKTDALGWYAWDVPEGMWQVRVTAEGYEDYATEWLPVLPVQTDVNIPLKATVGAKLGSIDACANAVEIKMSQYITDSTATSDNIYLITSGGEKANCKIKLIKSEDNKTEFSDRILLISDKENIAGSTLHITAGLLNYSGIATAAIEEKINEVKDICIEDDDSSLGDVNEDGKVDAKDASAILVEYSKMSTGGDGSFTASQKQAADVNADNKIDAKDASFILSYYALASTATGDVPTMNEYMSTRKAS